MTVVSNLLNDLDLRLAADGCEGDFRPRNVWRTARKRFKRRWFERTEWERPRFFCQNSGACGSTYIVRLLSDNGIARCFHEKQPDLNQLGIDHHERPLTQSRLTGLLRYTRWDVFFEANNRLFSLSKPLATAFPGARFIHLHRDGRAAVVSGMSKPDLGTYLQTNLRFQGSLAGRPDDRHLVRCCLYWNNMNRRILDDLESMTGAGPHLSLSFDDLIAGNLDQLAAFLGQPLKIRKRDVVNRGRVRSSGKYPAFAEWPVSDQQVFWDICGNTMERLGYR